MNLRELTYICSVAELGHFGKAADQCGVSQPTLSGQIKKLENELGVTIFERDNKRVHLTETGARIVELAKDAIESAAAIKRTAEAARDPFSGDVRIGFIPTIAPFLIPAFSQELERGYPNLSPVFREDVTEALHRRLLDGELDFVVLATTPESDRLEAIALHTEEFWVILPEDHPLAMEAEIDAEDLSPDEILLLTEGHCFRDQMLEVCGMVQNQPKARVWATSLETLINLVAAKKGVTLVPAMSLGGRQNMIDGVAVRPLIGHAARRTIMLVHRKTYGNTKLTEAISQTMQVVLSAAK